MKIQISHTGKTTEFSFAERGNDFWSRGRLYIRNDKPGEGVDLETGETRKFEPTDKIKFTKLKIVRDD